MNRNIPNVADELLENFRTKYDDKKLSELAGQTLAANQKRAIEYALIRNSGKRIAIAKELNIDTL